MSSRTIILDTDVASLSIKNALPPALLRELLGAQIGITFVTLGELSRWAHLRNWGSTKTAGLEAWLSTRPTLPYNEAVARRWGEISAYATKRGRPRPQNDSWIAACCLAYDLPLATLNVKDFADFAEYEGLRMVGCEES
ncbi:type II toxin-antitoxin system VapC family toxin [Kribbella sp. NPDC004536]|uniref:type II toxin-antitoxin system VapC family toxin n=1 Tax=Kribbella sp. NPDC004536 TaxID=3364106 RepID=UPI0036C5708F